MSVNISCFKNDKNMFNFGGDKLKKKAVLYVLILVLITSMAIGCAGEKETAPDGNTDAEKIAINFPTASTTGTIYPLGSAMSNVWNNKLDTVKVTAQASNGGVHNLNLLKDKEAQISFATTGIMWEALKGEGKFEGRKYEDVRVIAGLYYNPNQIVAREGSGVESIADFKGKNYVPGAPGSTPEVESKIHLTEYGFKYPDDINASFVGFTEAIDLMRNNQIDGALIMAGIPTAAVTEMTSTAGGKLLSIEEDVVKSLKEKYPWYSEFIIPAGTYANQEEDVRTTAIKMLLISDASVDEELIYQLVKNFWESLEELESAHPIVKQIKLEGAVEDLSGLPIHKGAERYYKEIDLLK